MFWCASWRVGVFAWLDFYHLFLKKNTAKIGLTVGFSTIIDGKLAPQRSSKYLSLEQPVCNAMSSFATPRDKHPINNSTSGDSCCCLVYGNRVTPNNPEQSVLCSNTRSLGNMESVTYGSCQLLLLFQSSVHAAPLHRLPCSTTMVSYCLFPTPTWRTTVSQCRDGEGFNLK